MDPRVLPRGDKHAVNILSKTRKKENNRYSVGLSWKEDTVTLPNNRSIAISRMISLEKKFNRQPAKTKYVETINQYIKDGHAMKIDINERNGNFNNKVNYIPHHAVTNINKPGKICISWKNFQDLQMNVHLFGKVDSHGCCIWAPNKTASDNIVKIVSCAEEAITDNFYMVDYLDSFYTLQEAIKISNDVANALSEGGFHLTKWVSNDQQILKALLKKFPQH